jgi:hypothetical protein
MSKIGLEKILEMMLIKEFPGIGRATVIPTSDDIDCKRYQVEIGLTPDQIKEYGGDNIRNHVKHLSKFVLDNDEEVRILFYNSERKY